MLMTFKTQKAMPADASAVWAEITHPDFIRHYFPEINSRKKRVYPSYVVQGSVIAWHQNQTTTLQMVNKDLNLQIASIEISLEDRDSETIVCLEVEFETPFNGELLHSLKAIRSLFKHKLLVLKQDFNSAQIDLAYA
jgi:hypothetical protein